MSAAGFVLAIYLFVTGLFATAFGIVARNYRAAAAWWLVLAYGLAMASGVFEFLMPFQADARPLSLAIFACFLLALGACTIGLALHYRVTPPWLPLALLVGLGICVNLAIVDMPRDSLLRSLLYQAPNAAMLITAAAIVGRRKPARALDMGLVALFLFCAIYFLVKPFVAMRLGWGTPQGYLGSYYAALSESVGAVLIITNGLLTLLIMVRDAMADAAARFETDALSGLLNRQGFEEQADKARLLAMRAGVPAVMVVAEIDDPALLSSQGPTRARLVAAFGEALKQSFDHRAVIGRLENGTFAVMVPGADLSVARGAIETARRSLREACIADGFDAVATGSFGVAGLASGDNYFDILRRADRARHKAQAQGRDQVSVAPPVAAGTGQGSALRRKA